MVALYKEHIDEKASHASMEDQTHEEQMEEESSRDYIEDQMYEKDFNEDLDDESIEGSISHPQDDKGLVTYSSFKILNAVI